MGQSRSLASSYPPYTAFGPRSHSVGLIIACEFFLVRIPFQIAFQLVADVAKVAERCGAMADLDICNRTPTGANALQPVLVMVVGAHDPSVVRSEFMPGQIRGLRSKRTAVYQTSPSDPTK